MSNGEQKSLHIYNDFKITTHICSHIIRASFFAVIFCSFCENNSWGQESTQKSSNRVITDANYSGKTLHKGVSFNELSFKNLASFDNVGFSSRASFVNTQFDSNASFLDAKFHSTVNFQSAKFHSTAAFLGAEFDSDASFKNARFDSIAYFNSVKFHSVAVFLDTKFHSTAVFDKANFDSNAFFLDVQFDSDAFFGDVKFYSNAFFKNSSFKGQCYFHGSILPDTLDFRYVLDIKYEIDFIYTKLDSNKNRKCVILLTGADISKIKINMQLFEIGFSHGERYEQRTSVYEKLLAKFKQDGFEESYQLLDIEYRRYKLLHDGSATGKFLNVFQTYWWNYGYNKEWVITRWTPLILFVFTFFNLFLFSRLHSGIYTLEFVTPILQDSQSWWAHLQTYPRRAFLRETLPICSKYALATVVYTGMIFFRLKIELEKSNINKHPWLFLYTLILYTIGLICTGFIANVIFTK